MCGISGIVDLRERRAVNPALLRAMNATLALRGPDGEGFHFEPGVGFGHRRLSIIDLEGGKQPLYNEDETVVVTYNGEIYNFKEVEDELVARGHRFRTRCDTEVIVHAWEEWGEECLARFNGMFAFAVWDRNAQTLFMARDRLGVKPLYYAELADGELIFGSELKALLQHPGLEREIDPTAVEEYFCFGYVPDPKTIFKTVRKLAPGHYLVARRGARPAVRKYWDAPLHLAGSSTLTAAEREAELRDRLKEAVRLRLVAEVPLGSFLSGGIDSSAVVAMMRELGTEHLLTCSIGFKEARYDESEYARLVATAKRTDHKAEVVEASDYGLLEKLVDIYDEPFADSSAIPTYRVCELARKHVTVALSGDGGDEDFLGYRRYRLFAMEQAMRAALPGGIRRPLFGALGRWYPKLDWAPRVFRAKTTFQALAREPAEAYLHGVSIYSDEGRRTLFSGDLQRQLGGYGAAEVFRGHLEGREFPDALSMVQYLDYQTYLPGDILTKVDRASMANSLEVRVPFLDYRFVEWAASLPTSAKLHGGEGKSVLKKALEPLLPSDVLYRKKMGFAVPLDIWFRGSLEAAHDGVAHGRRAPECGLFERQALAKIAADHRSGRRNYSAVLWALLMFEGFLGRAKRAASPARSVRRECGCDSRLEMHLLTFTNLYPSAALPRNGIFVEERLRQLTATGNVSARVLALRPVPPWRARETFAAERRHGIDVEYLGVPKVPFATNWLDPLIWAAAAESRARQLVAGRDDVVLDAHFLYPDGVAAVILGRRLGVPTVMTARGSDVNVKCENPVLRRWVRWAAARCAALITVSRALAAQLERLRIEAPRVEVLPNGVDLQKFQPRDRAAARSRLAVPTEGTVLASVGHLIPDKGHHVAIEALTSLPEATLLIVGEGAGRAALAAQARRCGVDARVRFLGLVPHEHLGSVYSAADALVLPSAREGMPNVVLESLACGTPVVATDVGGIGEVLTSPVAGRLMAERTAGALCAALRDLLAAAPPTAEVRAFAQRLGWASVIERQVALYRGVLDAPAKREVAVGAKPS